MKTSVPHGRERPDEPVAFARRGVEREQGIESEQRLARRRIGDDEARP